MDKKEFTTRVYQYGAVPLGPFPEAGIKHMMNANHLWNTLVALHNDNWQAYHEALCDADQEFKLIDEQLNQIDEQFEKLIKEKRIARMKAQTRSSDHPLIKAVNKKMADLKKSQRALWDQIKPARARAKTLIDLKGMNDQFREQSNLARQTENSGVSKDTADQVSQNFRTARTEVFKDPTKKRLRFHRRDGTGYIHYRLRDNRVKKNKDGTKYRQSQDGVTLNFLTSRGEKDDRALTITPSGNKGKKPRLKLRVLVTGGRSKESKVYALFDIVYHRPIPDGAQINNAKLLRRRVGDHFKFTINFSVRVPIASKKKIPKHALGIDIGFRRTGKDSIRAAMIGSTDPKFAFEEIGLSPDYVKRLDHIESLQAKMDDSATKLGTVLKPLLKAGSILPEDHKRYKLVRGIANLPSNVTMSFEQAYKMASWFRHETETLPTAVQEKIMEWRKLHYQDYRELHHLRKKTLAWRKEEYRKLASRLVSYGLPIGIEAINLSVFAEVKDKDNELSDQARSQRFMVSNSELIGAIKNASQREGIECIEINPKNTSKTCSACSHVEETLQAEMSWTCSNCGVVHDRDENATINIARNTLEKIKKVKVK